MNRQSSTQQGLGRAQMARLLKTRAAYGKAGEWQYGWEEINSLYPGMDIKAGLEKPELKKLLRAGLDFKTAFEAANLEEIKQYIELEAEKRMMERFSVNNRRPVENGIASFKSAPFSAGSGKMSKADREEIVKRVLSGEDIRL